MLQAQDAGTSPHCKKFRTFLNSFPSAQKWPQHLQALIEEPKLGSSQNHLHIYTVFVMMFIFTWLFLNSCFRCADLSFFLVNLRSHKDLSTILRHIPKYPRLSSGRMYSFTLRCFLQVKGFQLLPVQQERKSDPCDDQICCWVSWLLKKSHRGWWLKSPTTKTTATVIPGKLTAFRYLFFFSNLPGICVAPWRATNWYRRATSTYL